MQDTALRVSPHPKSLSLHQPSFQSHDAIGCPCHQFWEQHCDVPQSAEQATPLEFEGASIPAFVKWNKERHAGGKFWRRKTRLASFGWHTSGLHDGFERERERVFIRSIMLATGSRYHLTKSLSFYLESMNPSGCRGFFGDLLVQPHHKRHIGMPLVP